MPAMSRVFTYWPTVVGADTTGWGFMYSDYASVWCDKTVDLTVVAYRGSVWSAPSNAVQYVGPPCPPPILVQLGANAAPRLPSLQVLKFPVESTLIVPVRDAHTMDPSTTPPDLLSQAKPW